MYAVKCIKNSDFKFKFWIIVYIFFERTSVRTSFLTCKASYEKNSGFTFKKLFLGMHFFFWLTFKADRRGRNFKLYSNIN